MSAPIPPGAQPENDAAAAPQPQAPAPTQGGGPPQYATGFFDPRWVLLAGVWYMPAAITGFAIHYYFSRATCSFGMLNALCSLDLMAAPGQVALMLIGFAVALFVAASYGRSREATFLSARTSPQRRIIASGFTRLMCDMAEYQRVRPLARIIAALVAVGLGLEVLRGQLDGVTLALGLIALGVCLRCASYHPRRAWAAAGVEGDARDESPEQLAQERSLRNEASFWSAARNTPPLSWIARTRRQPARGAAR